MNNWEGTLQDVARYWFNLIEHITRSSITIPTSPDKKSTLAIMAYASWCNLHEAIFSLKALSNLEVRLCSHEELL